MSWTFNDCEEAAREMRALARVGRDEILPAREIGRAAGVHFTTRAPRGCAAQLRLEEFRVFLHAHGHPWTQNFNNGHELGHLIGTLQDDGHGDDEEFADWTALALLMPRAPTLAAVRRFGLRNPRALIAAFLDVPLARVILRAAWVCGRPVAVHRGGERLVWAPEGMPVPERENFWERRLVRRVRASGDWQASVFGMEAFPLGETGDEGVVVFLPDAEVAVGW